MIFPYPKPVKAEKKAKQRPRWRNYRRHKSEQKRTYGSPERAAFVKTLPCVVCGKGPSDNAHIRGDGCRRKGAAHLIVPLCHLHHTAGKQSLHALQPRLFQEYWHINLMELAEETDRACQQYLGAA